MAVRAPVTLTVLLVGDDQALVERALDEGLDGPVAATVRTVPDVAAAEGAFVAEPPDCVVVETAAVSSDARALVERLLALDADRPIVLLSADAAGAAAGVAGGATETILADVAAEQPALLAARIRRAIDACTETGLPGAPAWYDALLEDSMDALTVLDADGTISYQNPSVERLLGYEPEALVGTDSLEYVHPEDRERVRATFEALFERGDRASEDLEFRFRHADGSWEWLESVATVRLDPGIEGFVVNSRLVTQRKEREREVDRYETLLSVLPDTIAITDLEGTHVDIYGFEGWTGYDREELIGEHISITTPEPDLERSEEVVTDLILDDDRDKAIYETHIETKDGEQVPFENHVTPLPPDENGHIPGTMNVLRDLSDRKERERELQQAETVFQNVRDGVFLADVTDDGRFVYQRANEAYEEITGFAAEDVRGKTVDEFMPDEEIAAEARAFMARAAEAGEPVHEEHVVDVPGLPTYLEVWVAPVIVDDEVDSLVGVIRDITDRKERQRELELKNRAMDDAPIGITVAEVVGDTTELVYVNDGFETLTGYDAGEVLGEDWTILTGTETDPETVDRIREGMRRAENRSAEIQIYRRDGAPRWCQMSVSPILDDDGTVTHFVGFQQDVTDRKEYETEIERRFDEFADVFADDLREPLERAGEALTTARETGDEEALAEAAEWLDRAESLLADLARVHSFSVPSRDHSESALLGPSDVQGST